MLSEEWYFRVPIKDFVCGGILSDIAEGLAQWLRSLPPNPEVPGSIPGLVEGWIFGDLLSC